MTTAHATPIRVLLMTQRLCTLALDAMSALVRGRDDTMLDLRSASKHHFQCSLPYYQEGAWWQENGLSLF